MKHSRYKKKRTTLKKNALDTTTMVKHVQNNPELHSFNSAKSFKEIHA